jgi:hypothetical protein
MAHANVIVVRRAELRDGEMADAYMMARHAPQRSAPSPAPARGGE